MVLVPPQTLQSRQKSAHAEDEANGAKGEGRSKAVAAACRPCMFTQIRRVLPRAARGQQDAAALAAPVVCAACLSLFRCQHGR